MPKKSKRVENRPAGWEVSCCQGKERFLDWDKASIALKRVARAGDGRGGKKMSIYRCKACQFWHTGGTGGDKD